MVFLGSTHLFPPIFFSVWRNFERLLEALCTDSDKSKSHFLGRSKHLKIGRTIHLTEWNMNLGIYHLHWNSYCDTIQQKKKNPLIVINICCRRRNQFHNWMLNMSWVLVAQVFPRRNSHESYQWLCTLWADIHIRRAIHKCRVNKACTLKFVMNKWNITSPIILGA